jgi:hypothetical protein
VKRSRLNPRSTKKIAADKEKPEVRDKVFRRDGHRCILGHRRDLPPCFGTPCTPHHLRKEKQGGSYSVGNLVTLCAGHNDWVEQEPDLAHSLGLVARHGETAVMCWDRMRANELVAW